MKLELFYVVMSLGIGSETRIKYDSGPYSSFNQAFAEKTNRYPGDDSYIIVSSIQEVY